jgi:acylphosphatase
MKDLKHDSEKPARGFLLRISGRIQGVGFRYWTAKQAARLRVTGWVRNEADGTVSCACAGEPAALDAFAAALRLGPPSARVDALEIKPLAAGETFRRFDIIR